MLSENLKSPLSLIITRTAQFLKPSLWRNTIPRTLTAEGGQEAWLRSSLALPSPCTGSAHPGFVVHPTVTLLARGRKRGQRMRYASAEITGSCFAPKFDVVAMGKCSQVARLKVLRAGAFPRRKIQ